MVRPAPRRVPPYTAPALAVAALGFVVAGVLLGTTGLPGTEPRDPAPVLTRPASQVVLPARAAASAGGDVGAPSATSSSPSSADAAGGADGPPASAPDPQSVPAPGPSDGGDGSGSDGVIGGLVPTGDVLPVPVPEPDPDPLVDLGPLVDPVLDPVVDAAEGGLL